MDINSTAPDLREVLLGRNIVSDTVSDNGLSGLLQGIGNFVSIGHGTPNVHPSEDIELLGNLYRDLLVINNKHQGTLDDYRRISIINNSQGAANASTAYNINHADLLGNNELYNDLSTINNRYKQALGETQVIDIKLTNPLTPSDGEYKFSTAKLGTDDDSEKYRKDNTIKSKYLDWDAQLLKDIITTPVVTTKNLTNYMDYTSKFNTTNSSLTSSASNVLNSILGGTANGSIGSPNPVFDVTGLLSSNLNAPDTPLGIIAADRLLFAIQSNIGANLYEETLGNINTNPLSVMMGNDIIVPNYSITVAKGTFGGLLDYSEKILGFQVPVSLLSRSSSIFDSENPVGNIARANSMIENTGKGQVMSLFANLRASLLSSNDIKSGYAPGFVDKRDPNGGINWNIYAYGDGTGGVIDLLHGVDNNPISPSNYNGTPDGFDGLENITIEVIGDNGSTTSSFQWDNPKQGVSINTRFDKKTLLGKTQQLFSNANMVNMMTTKFGKATKSEINTTIPSAAGDVISKGSAVRKFNGNVAETDPNIMFDRAWTTFDKYDSIDNLQKHSGILPNGGHNQRTDAIGSVLDDNGFVKIGPTADEDASVSSLDNVKNYMFSIENLAWADVAESRLIPSEIGNGDTLTGNKGRIMWFPPYEMSFTDNTTVNWDTVDFIGRGEPMYTYNNTTRTGTLQFKIIIDHPSYLNNLRGESDELIDAFFAGSWETDDRVRSKFSVDELNNLDVARNQKIQEKNSTPTAIPDEFTMYFPYNDPLLSDIIDEGYEDGTGFNAADNPTGFGNGIYAGSYSDIDGITRNDTTNYGLNKPVNLDVLEASAEVFRECTGCKVTITTYGVTGENQNARRDRAFYIQDYIKDEWGLSNDPVKNKRYKVVDGGVIPVVLVYPNPITSIPSLVPTDIKLIKENIKVSVSFQWDAKLAEEVNPDKNVPITEELTATRLTSEQKARFYSEMPFFNKLKENDRFIYDSISDKIAFFHPSFHSITPEGFNSRLTFLQQCTRQGPTFAGAENRPDNLAFGRPPICILRIGDFYHTKIAIDNLNFTYEPLVWDLNPEGIGVQPMICTVDINFAFLGGSSLRGPINKLQNAISFNYFANTEVYDPRADTLSLYTSPAEGNGSAIVIDGIDPDSTDKIQSLNTNNTTVPDYLQTNTAAVATGPTVPPPAPVAAVTAGATNADDDDDKILSNVTLNIGSTDTGYIFLGIIGDLANLSKDYNVVWEIYLAGGFNNVLTETIVPADIVGSGAFFQSPIQWSTTLASDTTQAAPDISFRLKISGGSLNKTITSNRKVAHNNCDIMDVKIGDLLSREEWENLQTNIEFNDC